MDLVKHYIKSLIVFLVLNAVRASYLAVNRQSFSCKAQFCV